MVVCEMLVVVFVVVGVLDIFNYIVFVVGVGLVVVFIFFVVIVWQVKGFNFVVGQVDCEQWFGWV